VIKTILLLIVVAIFAAGATFGRYGNFNPCDWTAQDQADTTAVPKLFWEGRIKAKFLLKGITEPTFSECMLVWWESRADDAIEQAAEKALDAIKN
jgi:hypothetical protein